MTELSDANFVETVSGGVWAVDFWAAWCPPCRALAPRLHDWESQYQQVKWGKAEVEKCYQAADRLQVSLLPTIVFFRDGAEIGRLVGSPTDAQIAAVIATA